MTSANFGVVIFVPESSGLWLSEVGRIHFPCITLYEACHVHGLDIFIKFHTGQYSLRYRTAEGYLYFWIYNHSGKRFYYNDISKFIPDLFQNCLRNSQRDN